MLDISFWLVLFVIILFLGLVYYLNKTLYIPLMEFMQKREQSIQEDLANVNSNDKEIKELEEKAKAKILEAKKEANELKNSIIQKKKDEIVQTLEKKKEEFENDMQKFIKELSKKREELQVALEKDIKAYKQSLEAKLKKA